MPKNRILRIAEISFGKSNAAQDAAQTLNFDKQPSTFDATQAVDWVRPTSQYEALEPLPF